MDDFAVAYLPIEQLAPLVAKGRISPVELVELARRRIDQLNPTLNAFLALTLDTAVVQARRAEREIRRGNRRGPLQGIPVSIKDNIATQGQPVTAGSRIPSGFQAEQEATVVRRLRRAGAIVIGKANLHEFAYGVTSVNPHYGAVRNPWDPSRIAGGSSGGSASALAAGIGWGSIGSDTGGSLRIPASLCGIVGFKPTFGRVSRAGVVPLALSLDHVGPLATSVTGAAWLLNVISGGDPQDICTAESPKPPGNYARRLRQSLGPIRLGLPHAHFFEGIHPDVRACIEEAARVLERLGAKVEDVELHEIAGWVEEATEIALVEARHYHESTENFPARAGEYGADVRRLLERGGEVPAYKYLADLDRMRDARTRWGQIMEPFDALLMPATPIPAPLLGQQKVVIEGRAEMVRAALLRLGRPANFTGAPALVLPCGFSREGLPIGMQLMGRMWDEEKLLRIGFAYEQATQWHEQHPPEWARPAPAGAYSSPSNGNKWDNEQ